MQPELIHVSINGQSRQVPAEQSVAELLGWLKIAPGRVAVELNKVIVRKRDWEHTTVPSGSQVEIVEFVGGG